LTHPGHGGQKLDIFPADQVVIVLLRNGLRLDATAFDSTAEIRRRIFQILAKT
jgi:CubicO group peptidase (beta-lactamase class C family)